MTIENLKSGGCAPPDPVLDAGHGRAHPGPMRQASCLCGANGLRDDEHDAYYCPTSGIWLEKPCGDEMCRDCTSRPPQHHGALR